MAQTHPSASFSPTLRVHLDDRPGAFADVARAIGDAGGGLGAIDLVRVEQGKKMRDVTVDVASADHRAGDRAACRRSTGVEVEHVSDRTFLLHLGGKIEMASKSPLKTRDDLSMAYTPGVARVCHGDRRGSGQGLEADDQAQHGGRRHRRHRGARARRHRARRRRCR